MQANELRNYATFLKLTPLFRQTTLTPVTMRSAMTKGRDLKAKEISEVLKAIPQAKRELNDLERALKDEMEKHTHAA